MAEVVFCYINVPDIDVAQKISLLLVEARICAAVNIIPGMQTVYRWQNVVQREQEVVLIAKTTRDRFGELTALVKLNHPFKMPCIVALPVVAGEPSYMKWIEDIADRNIRSG